MLMEEEYRRRVHQMTSEVKKRLDYHVSRLCVREYACHSLSPG